MRLLGDHETRLRIVHLHLAGDHAVLRTELRAAVQAYLAEDPRRDEFDALVLLNELLDPSDYPAKARLAILDRQRLVMSSIYPGSLL